MTGANIKPGDMRFLEELFQMESGYVLDFTNRTFAEFFYDEIEINIYDPVYSSGGPSKAKRLRTFLRIGQKAAVTKILRALWEYREAIRRRSDTKEPLPNAAAELAAIIERVGGKPLRQPRPQRAAPSAPSPEQMSRLEQDFLQLMSLEPQPRGYAFERFLKSLFDAFGLEARDAFRLVGEQIDGSFQHAGETYLLEAKWQGALVDAATLRAFHGKVEDKSAWARGLFVSYAGFSDQGLQAFGGRRIILMDGFDLHDALARGISIADVIGRKVRRAAETGRIFIRVRDLFPA